MAFYILTYSIILAFNRPSRKLKFHDSVLINNTTEHIEDSCQALSLIPILAPESGTIQRRKDLFLVILSLGSFRFKFVYTIRPNFWCPIQKLKKFFIPLTQKCDAPAHSGHRIR